MKIHGDTITTQNVHAAAHYAATRTGAPVWAEAMSVGSRSRKGAVEVHLTSNGQLTRRRPNTGTGDNYDSGDYAASWDQWGDLLAHLFTLDPTLTIPRVYPTADEFHWMTGGRFLANSVRTEHGNHKWNYDGDSATGSYHVSRCKCGAIQRRTAHGRTFAELAA